MQFLGQCLHVGAHVGAHVKGYKTSQSGDLEARADE